MPPFLLLDHLVKSFAPSGRKSAAKGPPARRVLDGLTLAIGKGEVVALLGPSGSGKTTALRLVAGFEMPDAAVGGAGGAGGGRIVVEDQDVTALPPERRNFGMVFQHYALFPHLTLGENVAFGLEGRRLPQAEIQAKVAAALALVDLPGFERRKVGEISGGQQQRVALARALAPEPRVLLLDEPLSNLDPALRERTRRELRRAIRRVGITTLLVTHEQEEAFHLGDRVAVLEGGVLHQVGTPEELYDRPATRFVATFVGRASVLPGSLESAGAVGAVRLAPGVVWSGTAAEPLAAGEAVDLVVRPEALRLVAPGSPGSLPGRIAERRYAGAATYFLVELEGGSSPAAPPIEVEVAAAADSAEPGDLVGIAPLSPPGGAGAGGDRPGANRAVGRIFRRAASA